MTCILKYPVTIAISVPDIDTQILLYDSIQIHRSTSGLTGAYVEITTALTRPVFVADQETYEYIDEVGSPSYYYKFRYYNSVTLAVGSFSSAFQVLDEALQICPIEELMTHYLFGIDLTNDSGVPYPDSLYQHYIIAAIDDLETYLDIPIRTAVVEEERHDYYREDYQKYIWVELDNFPVLDVEEVSMVLPGETVVQVFNREWIHIDRWTGQLRLVPGSGSAGSILLGASGAWLPLIYGNNRTVPGVFRIKYRAGFGRPSPGAFDRTPGLTGPVSVPDHKLDRGVPRNIRHAAFMMASLGPLNIAGDLLGGAGIASQSIGIDGLSQSFATTSSATNAGYGARCLAYQRELKIMLPRMRDYYKGIKIRVA